MARKRRVHLRALRDELRRAHPEIDDVDALITAGGVSVGGLVRRNPASLVPAGAAVRLVEPKRLRGEPKLEAALERFGVPVTGRVALDAGAAAGGFTRVLLARGARRVYAVDAGHGQLLGSVRRDPRVVDLEATNLGELTPGLVPDRVGLVTLDLSYLSLAAAVPQLSRLRLAPNADLVGLVKPQFELGLPSLPTRPGRLAEAVDHAVRGITAAGWTVAGSMASPVPGGRGAAEFLVHAFIRSSHSR
jgi:23S rRNA (cytidine1920-2'-O)/16S rRNA (cytidine1409-2'-O)-methyltransferase